MGFSANVEKIKPSATMAVSALAKKLKAEGRDVIDMSAGEPDFDTPGFISDAAIEGIRKGKTRYTAPAGMPELKKAIAQSLSQRAGRELDPEGVVVTSGAKQALFNACFCLFGPGDEVLIASPYWTSYPEIVTLARATPVPVKGAEERDFLLTPADLERAWTPNTKGFIYSSPSNPTGGVYPKEDLKAVIEWCRDKGVWVIADEIYRAINFADDKGTPASGILELPAGSLGPKFVLVDGASKAFAMTGWRLGYSYCDPKAAKELGAVQSHVSSNANTPTQVGVLAAFTNPDKTDKAVKEMVAAFRRRRDLVTRLFDELLPDFSYVKPMGAFYLFFKVESAFSDEIPSSTKFCSWVLEETGVALVPGSAFGDDRYVRMSYANADAVLEDGIRRLAGVLARK
jgi:aspartate aminotransferase